MIFLFLFGCCVEDIVGRVNYTLMYLAGGIIAAFSYIAFSPTHFSSDIPMGGASGAISACLGMYLFLRADADIEFKYFYILFFAVDGGEFEIPAWIAIVFWFLRDVIGMAMSAFMGTQGGVAHGAHVGGLIAGCAMIGVYKLMIRLKKKDEEVPESPFASLRVQPQPAMAIAQPVVEEIATIYIAQDGQQSGPYTTSQVQAMVRLGSIGQDALYWSEGMTDWQSINEFIG